MGQASVITRRYVKMPVVVQWQNVATAERVEGLRRPGFETPAGSSFYRVRQRPLSASPRSGFVFLTSWDGNGFGRSSFPVAGSADIKRNANRCESMV